MNSKTTPKDFFVHLGAAIALYAAAGALINLAFSSINYALPDKLAGYFASNAVVWPVSMLIVLVPILYALEWIIGRDIARMPEKKDLWIRRWRIYLTLFLTVVLIGGDLIALLNVYFNGEITARFVYKVLVILIVAGTVGKYYYFSIAEHWRLAAATRRFLTWFGLVLAVAAIVSGFLIVGSPATQRSIRFDAQRINDLSTLQWQVISHWQQKQALPASLAELNDPISSYQVPADPETDAPYEYSVKSATSFELCAAFDLPSQDTKGRGAYGMAYPYPGGEDYSWKHEAGRACFIRTIDPDKYPPVQKPLMMQAPAAY